jgi:hypothetical protein
MHVLKKSDYMYCTTLFLLTIPICSLA